MEKLWFCFAMDGAVQVQGGWGEAGGLPGTDGVCWWIGAEIDLSGGGGREEVDVIGKL